MRRAQSDVGSQPVRNLFANPGSETTGSVQTIRTNLCTNPGIEAVGGVATTIRTNLATRPRMIDTSLGGYGTQTINYISGIPTHPDTITTAVRVAYNAGNPNPGAMIFLNPAVSSRYAVTAWVYNEGSVTEPMSIALQGEASAPGLGIVPGVWTRLEWVMTTSATPRSGFGVRIGSPSATGSFLVTGVTVELGPPEVVPYFFDGNSVTRPDGGSLTYSWSGSTGTSTSLQRGVTCPSFTNANQAIVYRVGTPGVSLAARVLLTNNTIGDSGLAVGLAFPGVLPSKTYTLSCDITTSSNRTIKLSIQGAGTVNTAVGFTHTTGVTVRRSITFQTNSSATSANVALYVLRNDLLMGWFDVDNILIEEAPVALEYFDGSKAATTDFTFVWGGTANAAVTFQRTVAPLKVGSLNAGIAASLEWSANGSRSVRVIPTGTVADSFAYLTISPPLETGKTYTVLATSRLTSPLTGTIDSGGRARRIVAYHSNMTSMSTPAPNTAGVTQHRLVFKCLDAAQYQNIRLYNGASIGNGDVWWDNIMLVEGEYAGDFIDGTKPFSKWLGTANDSASIGYPPQLLNIVGKPLIDVTVSGSYVLDNSFGIEEPRTFYSVYDVLHDSPPQSPLVTYGVTGLTDTVNYQTMMLRLQMSGNTLGALNRRTGGAGPISYNLPKPSASVTCWGMNGSGIQFVQNNGNGLLTSSQVMATPHQQLDVFANDSFHKHIRTIMFRGFHDAATRTAISRYLGNKYGAAVA